jgi:hypothetical protein
LFISFCEIGFQALGQLSAREHHAMAAPLAFKADVSAEAHDPPFVRTTGMRLAETKNIVKLQIREHE